MARPRFDALCCGPNRAQIGPSPQEPAVPTPMKTIALTLLALASAAAPANAAQPAPWQPVPGLTQIPLWPEGLAIQRPETTESETSGHGSRHGARGGRSSAGRG